MRQLLNIVTALCLALATPIVIASQEGVLILSEFSISSQGIGSSGPVHVSGSQSPSGISQLKVSAFDRELVAPDAIIKELHGFFANGILLSYEHGYTSVGGRTVYLSFFKGFTSGISQTKRFFVNERGEFKLLEAAGQ